MNSVSLKTNKLLTYHYGCHANNLVTIAIMPIVLVTMATMHIVLVTIAIMPIVPRKD